MASTVTKAEDRSSYPLEGGTYRGTRGGAVQTNSQNGGDRGGLRGGTP